MEKKLLIDNEIIEKEWNYFYSTVYRNGKHPDGTDAGFSPCYIRMLKENYYSGFYDCMRYMKYIIAKPHSNLLMEDIYRQITKDAKSFLLEAKND